MRQPFGSTLVGGDDWNWNVALDDCDSVSLAGATLKYVFFRDKDHTLELTALAGVDGTFAFSASGAQTSDLVGSCSWASYIVDSNSKRTELARGTIDVLPDIEHAPDGFDGRSQNKRMLDAVCAVLENRASRVEEEYQIGGRHLRLLKPDELLKLKGDLQSAYNRELVQSGQRSPRGNQLKAAFGPRTTGTGVWK